MFENDVISYGYKATLDRVYRVGRFENDVISYGYKAFTGCNLRHVFLRMM